MKTDKQWYFAYSITYIGVALLILGCWLPPVGIIDSSILVAFGEILTFAGSIIGIDYHYKYKD